MRIWKQVTLSLAVLSGGLCLWLFVRPDAASTLVNLGVPRPLVSFLAPAGQGTGAQGTGKPSLPSGAQQVAQGAGQAGQGSGAARGVLVVTRQVETGTVNDHLNAIGDGQAIQSVVVMPQASGTVTEIRVASGQKVRKGDILARLDDDEQRIERDKAQVALRSAVEKSQSYRNLQSVARLDVLDAQIAEESARLALGTAELNLRRRDIVAPIDGVAGIVAVNIGDNVTPQTSIVMLDDRSQILVDFWAPERFVTQLKPGLAVEANAVSRPGQTFRGEVQSIDNRVDSASRTIRVRARIDNASDLLRAGMSFSVAMRFPGDSYPAVDPLSVQWDAEGAYVWAVEEAKARKVRVKIIQRNPDRVLVEAALEGDDHVVTEGLQRVREGQPLRVQGASPQKVAEAQRT
ncbi:efflux RND transporter periplasmic adaptor subunit [Rhizobium straminoryzae]|uniref:Efflux RND transporter periplasmic adaptor subunit n=1 Tax=Rhizobium straminoryzae TaxID=1387186 RepID=A0A549T6G4_9HYPH|nr:efflux RND transporter periplasmic adaptor subunit [Rhizobium straminoryzae]TRL37467.1 efflux RND transporter periplasmic adaptor subunit [Rhizobium straminoryzae]